MALEARKLKPKSILNKSRQSLITQTTNNILSNSTPRRSIKRLLDKANVAFDGPNEVLVTTETNDGSFERGESTTTNPTNESDNMPQNAEIRSTQVLTFNQLRTFKIYHLKQMISQVSVFVSECMVMELATRSFSIYQHKIWEKSATRK